MSNHHRPRVNREHRNRLLDYASTLNGREVTQMNDALAILGRYLDVLYESVDTCPDCGTDYVSADWRGDLEMKQWELNDGQWYCYRCRAVFNVFDYLNPDNGENAEVPSWR